MLTRKVYTLAISKIIVRKYGELNLPGDIIPCLNQVSPPKEG
ncbi:hypothetical protein RintRC_7180 [Richelia intracellularis]|nr:hypothetical protein RintRC_7180 [Richelia intracellularis]